jgi:hypothetical protein
MPGPSAHSAPAPAPHTISDVESRGIRYNTNQIDTILCTVVVCNSPVGWYLYLYPVPIQGRLKKRKWAHGRFTSFVDYHDYEIEIEANSYANEPATMNRVLYSYTLC